MSIAREDRRKPEVEIRQMEIDDVAAVYHLGEELFTSEGGFRPDVIAVGTAGLPQSFRC